MSPVTDSNIDGTLVDCLHGLTGVFDADRKMVLMVASEGSTNIRKGQCVGSISSVLQVPDDHFESKVEPWTEVSLKEQVNLNELSDVQQAEVLAVMFQNSAVFSSGDCDIGHASVTQHHIKLSDETPIFQRPRRFPQPVSDEIERQCHELNSLDIIEPSMSPGLLLLSLCGKKTAQFECA